MRKLFSVVGLVGLVYSSAVLGMSTANATTPGAGTNIGVRIGCGTGNACNDDDGCPVLNNRLYIRWYGLDRCDYGSPGCNNSYSEICKIEFNCYPPCSTLIYPGTNIYEPACD